MSVNNNADDYANARVGIFFPGVPQPAYDYLTGQCVSLAKWYIGEMCGVADWQAGRGNAKDFGDTLVSQGLATLVKDPNQRRRGDIVVWKQDGGGYGHIGVLCSSDNVFEENVGLVGTKSAVYGGNTVYAARLDALYAPWRTGAPTFYRLAGYVENQPAAAQPQPEGGDMITAPGLKAVYNAYLGRDPDQSAIDHYIGHYTVDFVVNDVLNSAERQQYVANQQAQAAAQAKSLSDAEAALATEKAKSAGLAQNLNDSQLAVDEANRKIAADQNAIKELTDKLGATQDAPAQLTESQATTADPAPTQNRLAWLVKVLGLIKSKGVPMTQSQGALAGFGKSLLSRKFLVALVGAIVVFGNHMWNWGLTTDQVWAVLTPLLAYLGIEGAADIKSRANAS